MTNQPTKAREFFGFLYPIMESTSSGKVYPFWMNKEQSDVAARWDWKYKEAEKLHVIEISAYTKAVEALKFAQKDWCIVPLCECHICSTLKQLGEMGE